MQTPSPLPQERPVIPILDMRTSSRAFTRRALFALLGAVAATSAFVTAKTLYPTKAAADMKIFVGTARDLPARLARERYIVSKKGKFFLLPATGNAVIAVKWNCTHLGCTLPPPGRNDFFDCPCHGSRFTTDTGDLIHGPAQRPLDYFPIILDQGDVIVNTAKPIMRTGFHPSQATILP